MAFMFKVYLDIIIFCATFISNAIKVFSVSVNANEKVSVDAYRTRKENGYLQANKV